MHPLAWGLLATLVISLASLSGLPLVYLGLKRISGFTAFLVAFSAGALMGGAFLHLLPEAAEKIEVLSVSWCLLAGVVAFFVLERLLRWRHCHEDTCAVHPVGYLNLIGDCLHNFLDGVIIAAAFLESTHLGLVMTLVILAHEVPQEIGDLGVLVHSGLTLYWAVILNLLVALTAILGIVIGYYALAGLQTYIPYVLAVSAGGFLYISACDLIPELHKERRQGRAWLALVLFILGIGLMEAVKHLGHAH
ncbi:MAG: ZIP family metal transporter [Actinobacteria bacterium]|nr:ZIP family metal transporter [Actinomycetota bacterium]